MDCLLVPSKSPCPQISQRNLVGKVKIKNKKINKISKFMKVLFLKVSAIHILVLNVYCESVAPTNFKRGGLIYRSHNSIV